MGFLPKIRSYKYRGRNSRDEAKVNSVLTNAQQSTGPLAGYTENYQLNLVNFDWITWHTYEWENWVSVDALLQVAIGFLNIRGIWRANTEYTAGQSVLDPQDTTALYLCLQNHTSGTDFEVDKPLYWELRENSDPPVTSVFGRIGDVIALEGDYEAFYSKLGHTHSVDQITDFDPADYLPLIGGTLSGNLVIDRNPGGTAGAALVLDNDITGQNSLIWREGGVNRWFLRRKPSQGDYLYFSAYDNAGTFVRDVLRLGLDGSLRDFEDKQLGREEDILKRVRWRHPYNVSSTYEQFDLVLDGVWTMIANKQTMDRAAPQLTGEPAWDLADAPAWTDQQFLGVVRSGREWDVTIPSQINAYAIWAPTLTDNTNYTIWLYRHPTGQPELIEYEQVPEPILNEDAWTTVSRIKRLIPAGTTIGILVDALNSGSSVAPGGTPADWTREVDSNNVAPLAGGWNVNNNSQLLRIHETTADTDIINMIGVITGSRITFTSAVNPDAYITYYCQTDEIYSGNVYSWTVQEDDVGPAGAPPVGQRCVVSFDVPVAASTDYVQLVGGNPGANTRGVLFFDGAPVNGVENDAFGVRIEFEEYIVSPDWDIVAYSGGGGSGGSSGGGEGGSVVTTGPEFPTTPTVGNMHWLTVSPVGLYIYYDDGDSQQWVQTNGGVDEPVAPVEIVEADTASGWQVWGDVLVQWGTETIADGAHVVTFPQSFADTAYAFTATGVTDTANNRTVQINSVIDAQNIGIRVKNESATNITSGDFQWIAVGEAPDALKKPKTVQTIGGSELQEYHDPTGVASYRIVGNTLECWGEYTGGGGTIVFPKTFARRPVVTGAAETTNIGDGTTVTVMFEQDSVTTTQLVAQTKYVNAGSGGSAVDRTYWHAIGEWDGVS